MFPKAILISIIGFVVLVNVITFMKIRKRRNLYKDMSSVKDFHEKYVTTDDTTNDPRLDFITREDLCKQVQDELHHKDKKQIKYEFKF